MKRLIGGDEHQLGEGAVDWLTVLLRFSVKERYLMMVGVLWLEVGCE